MPDENAVPTDGVDDSRPDDELEDPAAGEAWGNPDDGGDTADIPGRDGDDSSA